MSVWQHEKLSVQIVPEIHNHPLQKKNNNKKQNKNNKKKQTTHKQTNKQTKTKNKKDKQNKTKKKNPNQKQTNKNPKTNKQTTTTKTLSGARQLASYAPSLSALLREMRILFIYALMEAVPDGDSLSYRRHQRPLYTRQRTDNNSRRHVHVLFGAAALYRTVSITVRMHSHEREEWL